MTEKKEALGPPIKDHAKKVDTKSAENMGASNVVVIPTKEKPGDTDAV